MGETPLAALDELLEIATETRRLSKYHGPDSPGLIKTPTRSQATPLRRISIYGAGRDQKVFYRTKAAVQLTAPY
jgi:hypothetical protein